MKASTTILDCQHSLSKPRESVKLSTPHMKRRPCLCLDGQAVHHVETRSIDLLIFECTVTDIELFGNLMSCLAPPELHVVRDAIVGTFKLFTYLVSCGTYNWKMMQERKGNLAFDNDRRALRVSLKGLKAKIWGKEVNDWASCKDGLGWPDWLLACTSSLAMTCLCMLL